LGAATNFNAGLTPVAVIVKDFNQDGNQDIAVANSGGPSQAGNVSILFGNGSGSFGTPLNLSAGNHPYAVASGNFNADGIPDLVAVNYDSNNVSLFFGNGSGGFGSANDFAVGSNPRSVVVGDFNNDNKSDLATANQGSNNISVLFGNGAGGVSSSTTFSIGSGPVSIASGDLNNDGKVDLVTANIGSNSVSVLLGDGLGSFAQATNFGSGSAPFSTVVGDFFGDGKPDVAVSNSAAGTVAVLVGDGAGNLSAPVAFAVGNDPRIIGAGDLNGDNKPDIAAPNFAANNVSVLINTSVVTAVVSGTVKDSQNQPVVGASVKAIDPSRQQQVANSITDSLGHYSLTVALGSYDLQTSPPEGSTLSPVTIAGLSVTADIVQDITLTESPNVSLSGKVLDREGQGIPNLKVHLIADTQFIETVTAADGSYSLQAGAGDYYLEVQSQFGVPIANSPSYFSGSISPFTITQNTIRNILVSTVVLSGIVRNPSGQPVPNVEFGCPGYDTTFNGFSAHVEVGPPHGYQVKSDASGFYRIVLLPGTLDLSVSPPANSGLGSQLISALNITADTTRNITLQQAFTLSGRVMDRDHLGIPNLKVHLIAGSQFIETITAADGSYSLQAGAGNYYFEVQSQFGLPIANSPSYFSGNIGTFSLTQDTARDIIVPTVILSGTVRTGGGQPLSNVSFGSLGYNTSFDGFSGHVEVGPPDGYEVKTNASGFYRIVLLPGTLDLNVIPPVESNAGSQFISGLTIASDTIRDITLQELYTLSGRVLDRDQQGIANLKVHLIAGTQVIETITSADGSYSLQAGAGDYYFEVQSQFGLPLPNAPSYFSGSIATFFLTQNTVRNIMVPTVILSGTVRNALGQLVPNVAFSSNGYQTPFDGFQGFVQVGPPNGYEVKSDGNGFYRVVLLPGTLDLSVIPPAGSALGTQLLSNFNITSDTTRDINLQAAVHRITGRITDPLGQAITGVTVALTGTQSAISTTDGNGNYVFVNLTDGGNYVVTPSRTSYQFSPANAIFNDLMSDQTANFTGTLVTYNVTGQVRDSDSTGVSGVTVTLSGAKTVVTQTNNAGAYAFNGVAAFTNYSVKPSKPSLTFTPVRTDIPNLGSNQIVDFTASAQPSPTPTPSQDEDFTSTQRDPDKFNLGSLTTDPTAFDPLVQVRQANGHLEVSPRADAFGTHYNGYTTVSAIDVGSGSPSVEVVQAASGAQTIFSMGSDLNNNFGFVVQPAGAPGAKEDRKSPLDAALLIFQIRVNGQLSSLSIPYDPVAHRYWRFRYDALTNSILFETSPDNLGWITRHGVVLQRSVAPMAVELSSGTSSTTSNPGTAVFDNFHLGEKFSISGQVKNSQNVGLAGVLMSLTGSASTTTPTSGSGNYSFSQLDAGGTYTVTPSLGNTTFSPPSRTFNSLSINQTADFATGSTPPIPTPPGNNINIQSQGVSVTFFQVTNGGLTTIQDLDLGLVGPMPNGYAVTASSVAFDVSTTATYTGPIDICFALPAGIDAEAFDSMSVLHKENGEWIERTVSRNFNNRNVCGSVSSLSPFVVASKMTIAFSSPTFTINEGNGSALINVSRFGDKASPATIDFLSSDGTALQRTDYTLTAGRLQFAAGEASKTIRVLLVDDTYVETNESLTLTLSNPNGVLAAAPSATTLTILDNDSTPPVSNPTDEALFFVRQHYYDFLSRVPDQGGLDFWTGQITQCGSDPSCIRTQRITVSNAFYYEQEYQQTGAYVVRLYRAAYGNNQPLANPNSNPQFPNEEKKLVSYAAFSPDRARVRGGSQLAQTQLDLANAFVGRPQFIARYPIALDGPGFVDALLATINGDLGVNLNSQRDALISLFNQGGRGAVLYRLADDNQTNPINNRSFIDAEYNRAFVLTQYFGYLRRNPDIGGFVFWLGQVNGAPLRALERQRAMVCSIITSLEYQQRFSSVATHNNTECVP
jgi:biotin operon repressor